MTSPARRRRLLFALLYFAEGGPIGLIWWALPTWLRADGMAPGDIALLMAWVTWPWTLKLLLAPLVDLGRGRRFGLRGWLVAAQTGMALTLLPLLLDGITADTSRLASLLVAHAFCAATQDVVIDTLAIRSVPVAERGAVNGWMQVGMLAGRALFGGGAILLAERFGLRFVLGALIVSLAVPTVALLSGLLPAEAGAGRRPPLRVWWARLVRMARSSGFWLGLALAALAGAGFESLSSLAGPFLLDRGASQDLVGGLFLAPTIAAMAAGALLGGWLSDRWGRLAATWIGELAAALLVGCVAAIDLVAPPQGWLGTSVAILLLTWFAMGMATAAVYTLLMDLTDRRVAATQFAAFMGGINLCYVWSTAAASWLLQRGGYGLAFAALAGVSLLALALLVPVGRRLGHAAPTT